MVAADAPPANRDTPTAPKTGPTSFRRFRFDACFDCGIVFSPCLLANDGRPAYSYAWHDDVARPIALLLLRTTKQRSGPHAREPPSNDPRVARCQRIGLFDSIASIDFHRLHQTSSISLTTSSLHDVSDVDNRDTPYAVPRLVKRLFESKVVFDSKPLGLLSCAPLKSLGSPNCLTFGLHAEATSSRRREGTNRHGRFSWPFPLV